MTINSCGLSVPFPTDYKILADVKKLQFWIDSGYELELYPDDIEGNGYKALSKNRYRILYLLDHKKKIAEICHIDVK